MPAHCARTITILFFGTITVFFAQAAHGQTPQPAAGASPYPTWGQPAQSTPPAQPAPTDSFQAGGLAPPPPVPAQGQPATGATEQKLNESEKQDAKRGLEWFWINAEAGYQYVWLDSISSSGLLPTTVKSSAGGFMYGGGLGVRLLFLTLGARARMTDSSDWNLGTINGELGLHVPMGNVELQASASAGYAWLGGLNSAKWGGSTSIGGFDVRVALGLDYYVTSVFSIGASISGDMLGLSRAPFSTITNPTIANVASLSGSSVGAGITGALVLGLHF